MAVREKETNQYYRINFDECSVRGRKVFVNFNNYETEAERTKEKERDTAIAVFFQKLREHLSGRYEQILAKLAELKVEPQSALSPTEEGKIDAGRFPELREQQEMMNAIEPYEKAIAERLYLMSQNEKKPLAIPAEIAEIISAFGFDETWITDPVVITGGADIYVGDYNDEPINQEFYYARLKAVMGVTEDC